MIVYRMRAGFPGLLPLRRRGFLQAAGLAALTRAGSAADPGGSITDVSGIRVGHFTDTRRPTGCTVLIFDNGATAGVDVRGAAPGTRETDLLQPVNTVQKVNAILLSGGSAFGLDAASGVMRFLEEQHKGFQIGGQTVPIVVGAVLFDLTVGNGKIRPDAQAGFAAASSATKEPVVEGNIGAGAGATVGKLFGAQSAMKSGLGSASLRIGATGVVVGAIVAVNSVGDVWDRESNRILAGARTKDRARFLDGTAEILRGSLAAALSGSSTTIGAVVTNAVLTKTEATKIAQMAHDGLARTIRPVH